MWHFFYSIGRNSEEFHYGQGKPCGRERGHTFKRCRGGGRADAQFLLTCHAPPPLPPLHQEYEQSRIIDQNAVVADDDDGDALLIPF